MTIHFIGPSSDDPGGELLGPAAAVGVLVASRPIISRNVEQNGDRRA
eukprot:CAMPEP_0178521426 /NCGR_PEP_ID=MMETSP0696-20121128/27941_1 /TAXON_ID=265572 /ORGANISM="Extubocellulus spinifer, Strain CCMP396" /LENGTH=46 /DNA_ID= /DNA_START= /DNA_END= /DNA_ORIENTATION=